jgi:hypothetical protein
MIASRKSVVGIYVDKVRQQWIVRDPEGNYWSLPAEGDPWEHRQPFEATQDTELEPVPGHYRSLLGLPF